MPRSRVYAPIATLSVAWDFMPSSLVFGSVLVQMSLPKAKLADGVGCDSPPNPLPGPDRGKGTQFTVHAIVEPE